VPVDPELPDDPALPLEPAVPEVPEDPVDPEEPLLPEVPVDPEEPDDPLEPEDPDVPVEPDEPLDPELPLEPAVPEIPEVPFAPDVPAVPDVPAGVNAQEAVVAKEADVANEAVPNNDPVKKTKLPDTTTGSLLKVPNRTMLLENASTIGIPEISFTANKDPDRLSVIEKSCPCEPCTSKSVDPDPLIIRPLRTLNSFAICISFFHYPKGSVINIKELDLDQSIQKLIVYLIFQCRCKGPV
jgi:hypothetical protein